MATFELFDPPPFLLRPSEEGIEGSGRQDMDPDTSIIIVDPDTKDHY